MKRKAVIRKLNELAEAVIGESQWHNGYRHGLTDVALDLEPAAGFKRSDLVAELVSFVEFNAGGPPHVDPFDGGYVAGSLAALAVLEDPAERTVRRLAAMVQIEETRLSVEESSYRHGVLDGLNRALRTLEQELASR